MTVLIGLRNQYGTDLMETSVKTLSKPVINRMVGPDLVGQIDDFACRQLDRVRRIFIRNILNKTNIHAVHDYSLARVLLARREERRH